MQEKPLAPSLAKQLLNQTYLLKVNNKHYVSAFTKVTVWLVRNIT